jgi:hypothetical protein
MIEAIAQQIGAIIAQVGDHVLPRETYAARDNDLHHLRQHQSTS